MKIGVLGLGFMGSTHLRALANVPRTELGAVMDFDETRLSGDLSSIQGNLGGPGAKFDFTSVARYRSPEEIVADPRLDAIDICLPTHLHAPIAIAALEAGKHVFCEKPMALNGDEAEAMLEAAGKAGRVLMVAQVLRFFAEYTVLADLIQQGRLGQVRSAIFRRRTAMPGWNQWGKERKLSGGGIFDLLIHDVDQALFLFGVPEAVSSTGHEDMANGIDVLSSELHYPGIGQVAVSGGWYHRGGYPFSMEYTVMGDEGVVEYSSAGRPPTVYWKDGTKEVLPLEAKDGYQAEIEYFVDCCVEGRRPERCLPEDSATAVKLTNLMVQVRDAGGGRLGCRF